MILLLRKGEKNKMQLIKKGFSKYLKGNIGIFRIRQKKE